MSLNKYHLRLLQLVIAAFPVQSYACETWDSFKPEIKFQLEDTSFRETMAWTSGWSYAITSYIKDAKLNGEKTKICLCEGDVVSNKVILEALNSEFSGETITADQAQPVVWRAILNHYKCK